MSKKEKTEITATEKVASGVNEWLGRNFKLLLIILILVVVIVLGVVISTIVVNNTNKKLYSSLDSLNTEYEEFILLSKDDDGYSEKRESFINSAEALSKKSMKKYPAAKATLLLANLYFDEENYDGALKLYDKIISGQKDTYLTQVALVSKASCYEEKDDINSALDIYNKLFEDYGNEGIFSSRALFNVGRLYEELGQKELAIATYEQVIATFSEYSSQYASLAESRIAQIN